MTDRVAKEFRELVELYHTVKRLVLYVEETDWSSSANIGVIKEFRDACDHVMRCLNKEFCGEDQTAQGNNDSSETDYMLKQIDKAKGHVLRAGYDALDGLVASFKLKVAEELRTVSNEAIANVYPEYYSQIPEFDEMSRKLASHRDDKDVGSYTIDNLNKYREDAEQLRKYCVRGLSKVPELKDWDRKHRWRVFVEKGVVVVVTGMVVGFVFYWLECLSKSEISEGGARESAIEERARNR